jgi:hypothetical protein
MKKKYQVSAIVPFIPGRSHYVPRRWQVDEQETPFQLETETSYSLQNTVVSYSSSIMPKLLYFYGIYLCIRSLQAFA